MIAKSRAFAFAKASRGLVAAQAGMQGSSLK
jgi:hypothetical protein